MARSSDIVHPRCGRLTGLRDEGTGVHVFLGIPFAQPPVGDLRWRPPHPLAEWSGIRSATTVASRCIQHAPYGELEANNPQMSEDCLYLNVWTPKPAPGARLPVIYWIHGGEFWAGSGSEARYDGAKLAARGAVVVTINHRLGVYGFLSHPELSAESGHAASGNYGLMDQIAGLEWVRNNIEAFGGSPENVTIGGESAGSCSVSALMTAPTARGFFHRALGQSCAYFMPEPHAMGLLTLAQNEERGVAFAQAAGATSIRDLRTFDAQMLLETWLKDTSKRMQPCLDGHVLPGRVEDVFAAGKQARVPLLTGWNADESAFYVRGKPEDFDISTFRETVGKALGADAPSVLEAYPASTPVEGHASARALVSDRTMIYPTWKWANVHAPAAPTFVYRFDRVPPGSLYGAHHACEIEYVFGALGEGVRPWQPEDRRVSNLIGDYWVNFARIGDPNGAGLPAWPRYDPRADAMLMRLNVESRAEPTPERTRLEVLDAVYRRRAAQSAR